MERLEKFVIQHQAEFDAEVPSLKVWANIDKQLEQKAAKHRPLWKIARIAAAVVILLGIGSVIGANLTQNTSESASTLAEVAPEYAELESYYQNQINHKIQQLASYQHDGYVQEDLRQLDEVFSELRQELEIAPRGAEEQIIKMMIKNYETKVSILERVLEKIQSTTPNDSPIENQLPLEINTNNDEVSL